MEIQQAMGTPKGRLAGAAYLITERVEHAQRCQACHKDARHGAHGAKAIWLSGECRGATSVGR